MNSKRRETILSETNIFDILTKYEALTQSEKIATLQYHLLEIGTLTKKSLSPEYFDCLPPLTDLELETIQQNDPTVCISFSSFLDKTNCSVPDLEELPNPDSTNVSSFWDKIIKHEIVLVYLGRIENLHQIIINFHCKNHNSFVKRSSLTFIFIY